MNVSDPKCYRYVDVGKAIVWQANGDGGWQTIGNDAPMTIPVNGYLAVYLSNATSIKCEGCMNSEGDVYFDKVKIKFTRGNLKQETHYYPFGLPMAGIGSSAMGMTPNRQKYQSNEYITDAGLNWMSFGARQYDPQLGRFLSVDPLAAVGGQDMLSPYQAMGNNPVSSMDPGGTAYYSMENYVDNRGNRFYLSPGTIASLGLPWTGDPTGFTPPPSWDYGAFFDLSADIVTFQFYSAGYARLQNVIQQRKEDRKNEKEEHRAQEIFRAIVAFYDAYGNKGSLSLKGLIAYTGSNLAQFMPGEDDKGDGDNGGDNNNGSDYDNWGKKFSTAGGMFLQWLTGGLGMSTYNSFDNDEIAESFRNAVGVQKALNYYYNKYKDAKSLEGSKVEGFGVSFGIKAFFKAGFDPIEQYVGSYNVDIYFRPYANSTEGYLQVIISNNTSMTSAAYHALPSYDNGGPMSNAYQSYMLNFDINYSRFKNINQ